MNYYELRPDTHTHDGMDVIHRGLYVVVLHYHGVAWFEHLRVLRDGLSPLVVDALEFA